MAAHDPGRIEPIYAAMAQEAPSPVISIPEAARGFMQIPACYRSDTNDKPKSLNNSVFRFDLLPKKRNPA